MSKNLENMNVEKAVEIIKSGVMDSRFDAAVQFLQLNDPENPALQNLEQNISDEIKAKIDETFEAIRNGKSDRENALGDEDHSLNKDEKIAKNIQDITQIFESDSFPVIMANRDARGVKVAQNGDVLGEGEGKESKQIEDEKLARDALVNEVLEAAKHEVLIFYSHDKKFAGMSEEDKRDTLRESVSAVFNFKMTSIVAASAVNTAATPEQAMPGTKENKDYQEQNMKRIRDALANFMNTGKATIDAEEVRKSAAKTGADLDELTGKLQKGKKAKAAEIASKVSEKYHNARRAIWDKAYDTAKGLYQGIKQNKARIITDAAVVMGAGLAATAAPIAAAAAMGAYFAGSSFAWLINDERRNQKAKAEEKSAWSGLKGMRNAWKSIMGDEAKKSKFIRQGSITATAGVVGAGLFGAAASTMGLVYGRIASGAARSLGSVTSQGANWAVTAKEYKKNATEENKVALDSAKKGFWTSTVFSILGNTVSTALGLSHAADANALNHVGTENVAGGAEGVSGADVHAAGAETAGVESTGAETSGAESVATAEPVEVPTEWNADMGISENHWNEMMKKITGIYREHADIFGQENVSSEDAMQNMYQNIENARDAGYFEGQTNEEVLYKYMKLIEQTERAVPLKGTEYLVTKLDADGNPMYWVNAEEMSALNKIIICNEVTDVSADKIKGVMDLINDNGKYTGEGADIGVTNNSYAGGKFDCDEYQNVWKKGAFIRKHNIDPQPAPKPAPIHDNPTPKPAPEPTPAPKPEPLTGADETVVNNPKPQQPLTGANETTTNVYNEQKGSNIKYRVEESTGKNNTADSESGLLPKVKEQGTIPIPANSGEVAESVARAAIKSTVLNNGRY